MTNQEQQIYQTIDQTKTIAFGLNQFLYEHPELSNQEFQAYLTITELLKQAGMEVEEHFAGEETAFLAKIHEDTSSDIKIAILAEYDALPELGHACGHSVSAAISFLAALALFQNKDLLQGNIYLIGTPDEELNGGKIRMTEKGVFDDYSFAIMIHMDSLNQIVMDLMALDTYQFVFRGKPAHASANPWEGCNAVNGMMLMIHAFDMLRQQLRDGSRIHGHILQGGVANNIIPEKAVCEYGFRYPQKDYMEEIVRMAHDAARGCAMATQTKVSIRQTCPPFYDMKAIPIGNQLLTQIYQELGIPIAKEGEGGSIGSSDIGNVSYRCPAFHPTLDITDGYIPHHTREFEACVRTDRARQAIVNGAKIITSMILRSLADETILRTMKQEFDQT